MHLLAFWKEFCSAEKEAHSKRRPHSEKRPKNWQGTGSPVPGCNMRTIRSALKKRPAKRWASNCQRSNSVWKAGKRAAAQIKKLWIYRHFWMECYNCGKFFLSQFRGVKPHARKERALQEARVQGDRGDHWNQTGIYFTANRRILDSCIPSEEQSRSERISQTRVFGESVTRGRIKNGFPERSMLYFDIQWRELFVSSNLWECITNGTEWWSFSSSEVIQSLVAEDQNPSEFCGFPSWLHAYIYGRRIAFSDRGRLKMLLGHMATYGECLLRVSSRGSVQYCPGYFSTVLHRPTSRLPISHNCGWFGHLEKEKGMSISPGYTEVQTECQSYCYLNSEYAISRMCESEKIEWISRIIRVFDIAEGYEILAI